MPYHHDLDEPGDDDFPAKECEDAPSCWGNCDACEHRPDDETSSVYGDEHPADYWRRK